MPGCWLVIYIYIRTRLHELRFQSDFSGGESLQPTPLTAVPQRQTRVRRCALDSCTMLEDFARSPLMVLGKYIKTEAKGVLSAGEKKGRERSQHFMYSLDSFTRREREHKHVIICQNQVVTDRQVRKFLRFPSKFLPVILPVTIPEKQTNPNHQTELGQKSRQYNTQGGTLDPLMKEEEKSGGV